MPIRTVQNSDYKKLVPLYSAFFKTHNIFQQSSKKVIAYLKEQAQKDELLVYEDKNAIKGALFLAQTGKNMNGTHTVWKLRHFAFGNNEIGTQLLQEAEKRIQKASKTAKVELTIAETEKGINFYQKNGYKQEGILRNHYRYGEKCYILGKSFS